VVLVRRLNTFLEFHEADPVQLPRRRLSSSLRRVATDPDLFADVEFDDVIAFQTERAPSPAPARSTFRRRRDPEHKVFVGGLSSATDEATLFEFMQQFGPVKNVTVKRNPITGQSRRYAFVKFFGPPHSWIFQHAWIVDDQAIRVSRYEVSSEWKNHYYSDDAAD
jgi:hypothetical protein